MADMMEFDVARARKTTTSIDNQAKELDKQMKQVKKLIEETSSWWKGDSGKKFIEQYNKIEPNVKKLIECVTNISLEVKATADAKEKEEQEIAAQLSK